MKHWLAIACGGISLVVSSWGASIEGTVTDSTGFVPLEDIEATAYVEELFWWSQIGNATTDSNGYYKIEGLAAGTYCVGFEDLSANYVEEYYDDAPDEYSATNLVLGADQAQTGIDARLAPASRIAGTVAGPDGLPLEGVSIGAFLFQSSFSDWINAGPYVSTAADGTYVVNGLRAGTYRIQFYKQDDFIPQFYGGTYDMDTAADIVVPESATIGGIDATMVAGGRIIGLAAGPTGTDPLDEVEIIAYRRKGTNWLSLGGWSWTGYGGAFDLSGLRPGTYRLRMGGSLGGTNLLGEYYSNVDSLESAQDLVLEPGSSISNVNVELTPASHITGSIVDSNGDPAEAGIRIYQYSNGAWERRSYGETDGTGAFDAGGLTAGTYRVRFAPASSQLAIQWFSNSPTLAGARDVVLGVAARASHVDARLGGASHIAGTVTGTNGTPLGTVEVWAMQREDGVWLNVESDDTADDGTYDIGGLSAGTYRVGFWPFSGNYAPEYYNNALHASNALDVVVPGTATVGNVNAALVSGGRISGTVAAAEGSVPLADIEVEAYRLADGRWEQIDSPDTDDAGRYEITALPVGQFRLRFIDNNDVYAPEWYDNAPDESSAQTIVLTSAGQILSNVNASLDRIPAPPAPQSPELLGVHSAGLASWALEFTGEIDVDYRLQRLRPTSNDWFDTGSIAVGTGPTNEILHSTTNALDLLRVRTVP
ncbi:MAG: hypothetical protein AB7V14_00845 [Kiritimatiellia bacterium]